jgi:6-pyruvoyltetrahydropterin/6-carboxytetrahydropterin synthase
MTHNITLHLSTKFSASHYLPDYQGECSNLHGHTWRVDFDISGASNNKGFLIDFRKLKQIVKELDHKHLNDIIENPTAENISMYFLEQIKRIAKEGNYHIDYFKVRVYEGDDSWVETSMVVKTADILQ